MFTTGDWLAFCVVLIVARRTLPVLYRMYGHGGYGIRLYIAQCRLGWWSRVVCSCDPVLISTGDDNLIRLFLLTNQFVKCSNLFMNSPVASLGRVIH